VDLGIFIILAISTPALLTILEFVLMFFELLNHLLEFSLFVFNMFNQPFIMLDLFAHGLDFILQFVLLLLVSPYLLTHHFNLVLQLPKLEAHNNNHTEEDSHHESLRFLEEVSDMIDGTFFIIIIGLKAGLNRCFLH